MKKGVEKIYRDIKEVKIQGATNIARAALKAYTMDPSESTKKKLLKLRPTEPMLSNVLNFTDSWSEKKILKHFSDAQARINKAVYKLIMSGDTIYTHCHSTNVVKALIYAKKKGKRFSICNTETRPLYQGRKTARELSRAGIKVTMFVDSAVNDALDKCDKVFLGADAILKSGVVNKIGSETIAQVARLKKKKVYVIADSWKFSPKNVKIEVRSFKEVWRRAPKSVKIKNLAFEAVPKKYITGIVSEYGLLKFDKFVRKADRVI